MTQRERESTRTPALHSTKRERGKGSITRLQLGGRSEAEQADGEEMRRAIIDGCWPKQDMKRNEYTVGRQFELAPPSSTVLPASKLPGTAYVLTRNNGSSSVC